MLLTTSMVIAMLADAATAKPKKDKDDPDRLVCRRETVTGSLVSTKRTCLTRKQWTDIANDARRDTETLQDQTANATRGN